MMNTSFTLVLIVYASVGLSSGEDVSFPSCHFHNRDDVNQESILIVEGPLGPYEVLHQFSISICYLGVNFSIMLVSGNGNGDFTVCQAFNASSDFSRFVLDPPLESSPCWPRVYLAFFLPSRMPICYCEDINDLEDATTPVNFTGPFVNIPAYRTTTRYVYGYKTVGFRSCLIRTIREGEKYHIHSRRSRCNDFCWRINQPGGRLISVWVQRYDHSGGNDTSSTLHVYDGLNHTLFQSEMVPVRNQVIWTYTDIIYVQVDATRFNPDCPYIDIDIVLSASNSTNPDFYGDTDGCMYLHSLETGRNISINALGKWLPEKCHQWELSQEKVSSSGIMTVCRKHNSTVVCAPKSVQLKSPHTLHMTGPAKILAGKHNINVSCNNTHITLPQLNICAYDYPTTPVISRTDKGDTVVFECSSDSTSRYQTQKSGIQYTWYANQKIIGKENNSLTIADNYGPSREFLSVPVMDVAKVYNVTCVAYERESDLRTKTELLLNVRNPVITVMSSLIAFLCVTIAVVIFWYRCFKNRCKHNWVTKEDLAMPDTRYVQDFNRKSSGIYWAVQEAELVSLDKFEPELPERDTTYNQPFEKTKSGDKTPMLPQPDATDDADRPTQRTYLQLVECEPDHQTCIKDAENDEYLEPISLGNGKKVSAKADSGPDYLDLAEKDQPDSGHDYLHLAEKDQPDSGHDYLDLVQNDEPMLCSTNTESKKLEKEYESLRTGKLETVADVYVYKDGTYDALNANA